ncbi:MAG: GNAT family N-acetyltransferase [Thalassotalea sp.]
MKIKNSARLEYKKITATDHELLYQLDQDPEVMRYLTNGEPTSRATINGVFIPRVKQYSNTKKGWGLWQAITLNEREFIGWIIVRPFNFFHEQSEFIRNDQTIELGWRFKQSAWGQGYATEAATTIMTASAKNPHHQRFCATALAENTDSIKVMKKLGMEFIKNYSHVDKLGERQAVYYQLNVEANSPQLSIEKRVNK